MAPNYAWTCHLCEATNPASTSSCLKCNFPSEASAAEIQLAKSSGNAQSVIENREENKRLVRKWAAQQWWKITLDIFCLVCLIIGIVFFRFAIHIDNAVTNGILLVILSVGIYWLIHNND